MTHTKETNVLNQNIFFDPIAVPVHGQLLCGEEGKIGTTGRRVTQENDN
tara:strand:- start:190 stop:336 length:147 start_codon:yes stop_codon:yes gene_type:complete